MSPMSQFVLHGCANSGCMSDGNLNTELQAVPESLPASSNSIFHMHIWSRACRSNSFYHCLWHTRTHHWQTSPVSGAFISAACQLFVPRCDCPTTLYPLNNVTNRSQKESLFHILIMCFLKFSEGTINIYLCYM